MRQSDFLVVGAGIAGVSVACGLAATGSVLLLEAEPAPGRHATGRSAALFSETYGNVTIRALSRASRRFLEAPPPGFIDVPLLRERGVLYVGDESQQALLEMQLAADGAGRLVAVDATMAFDRVPILRRDRWRHFLLERDASDIDVDALFQGFLRRARQRGAVLVPAAPVQALDRQGLMWVAHTPQGRFAAPVVINAAGAWADELAALAGVRPIGVEPRRRTALLIDTPAGLDIAAWPLVVDAAESFYFKPDAGRLLVSPADETPSAPCDVHPDDLDVAIAVDRFEQATNVNVRKVTHTWAGLRSFVADRAPVVGFDPGAEGFFWLAAQGGYGIQTAPAMADLAAALARGQPIPANAADQGLDAADLSPARLRASG
jgi:D-arginine dehydrogenase